MCKSTPSGKKFDEWIDILGLPKYSYIVVNIHNKPLPNNRQLKTSDIDELDKMLLHQNLAKATKVVTLGVIASAMMETMGVEYFSMPHPSPVSRKHNDPEYIQNKLKECRNYVLNTN